MDRRPLPGRLPMDPRPLDETAVLALLAARDFPVPRLLARSADGAGAFLSFVPGADLRARYNVDGPRPDSRTMDMPAP